MKRYLNYLLLLSNFVIAIIIAVILAISMKEFNNVNNTTINLAYAKISGYMWLVITASVLGIGLFSTYVYLLRKEFKQSVISINPRLERGLIYTGIISFVNYTIPVILAAVAIYTQNKDQTILMLWFAFGISATVGLVIAGFTSYYNLRISWANVRREQLKTEALEENASQHEFEEEQIKKDKKTPKSKATKSASTTKDTKTPKIDQPTSGSF